MPTVEELQANYEAAKAARDAAPMTPPDYTPDPVQQATRLLLMRQWIDDQLADPTLAGAAEQAQVQVQNMIAARQQMGLPQ